MNADQSGRTICVDPRSSAVNTMALIDKIFGTKKTLSELSRQELRREEILLTKHRERLFKRIGDISTQKQKIFQQGAQQKSPELRKALAQDFELKTQEQLMAARELNLRSKELLTVSRLRMVKENNDKGRALGRLNLTDKDVAKISGWIEDDSITQDAYNERLNMILELGSDADKDAMSKVELASQGNELMALWEQVDRGDVKEDQAFEQADEAVRRRNSPMDQEQ
jgi:hypothetical protein